MSKLSFDVYSESTNLQYRVIENESGDLMLCGHDGENVRYFVRNLDEFETDFVRSAYEAGYTEGMAQERDRIERVWQLVQERSER